MHYKNGREAKAGDKVISLDIHTSGVLYNLNTSSSTCNGTLAPISYNNPCVTLSERLHVDDIVAAAITDSSKA